MARAPVQREEEGERKEGGRRKTEGKKGTEYQVDLPSTTISFWLIDAILK